MTIRNLDKMLRPRSVALIGASERKGSVGLHIAENLLAADFAGPIGFVNPRHTQVVSRPCYANAEALPFEDDSFDLVVSSGVLHHTPDFMKAMRECHRVLRPGGEAKITLYRKGLLHHHLVWPLIVRLMRLAGVQHPGADLARTAIDVDDFIRLYDGADNPLGLGKTNYHWARLLREAGFQVDGRENRFFPRRFLPFSSLIPPFIHQALEGLFGTMVYFKLKKPNR